MSSYYRKELLLFQSYNEHHPIKTHNSDTSDNIEKDLRPLKDTPEMFEIVFDDDPLCTDNDKASLMLDNEIHKSVDVDDFHQPSRSKTDPENIS